MAEQDRGAAGPLSLDPGYLGPSQADPWVQKAAGWDEAEPRNGVLPLRRGEDGKAAFVTPHSVTGPVSGIAKAMMHLVDAMHGVYDPTRDPTGAVNDALSLATAAIPAGASAPRGAIGMFAGAGAKTADHKALAVAKQMEGFSLTPDEIWQKTGWFKGPDDKWKWEIPDHPAQLSGVRVNQFEPSMVGPEDGSILGSILDHPDLFAAYPDLAKIPVKAMPLGNLMQTKGAHVPGDAIYMRQDTPEEFFSTLLHETQHAIQSGEGFGLGGSPSEWWKPEDAALLAGHKGTINSTRDLAKQLGYNPSALNFAAQAQVLGKDTFQNYKEELARFAKDQPELHDDFLHAVGQEDALRNKQGQAFDNYNNLAGEIESRTVEARDRQGLGAETPPWQTQGYPAGPQTVRLTMANGQDGAATLRVPYARAKPEDLTLTHLGGQPMEEMEEYQP